MIYGLVNCYVAFLLLTIDTKKEFNTSCQNGVSTSKESFVNDVTLLRGARGLSILWRQNMKA